MVNYPVNLPKTNFAMRANLPNTEPKILEFWENINLYQYFYNPHNKRKFILHDGPPYANGAIHLGHAFNKFIKDIINKSKLLEGYSVPYVPGWDCHGLPIELNVEKNIGKPGIEISVEEFILACRKYAAEQMYEQMQSFKRLGIIGNWEQSYKTMDFTFEANAVRALAKIIDHGHVIRGYKPVHWCINCKSALAEAEVEYLDKISLAIDVKFQIINAEITNLKNVIIPIWTTTPWSLPANEAVAIHPNIKYVLVNCITLQEKLLIAENLLQNIMSRYGENNYSIINTYLGKELINIKLQHPFIINKKVPLIFSDHVTVNTGTGAVHIAPGHGPDDFKIGMKYNLPINNPVEIDGKFTFNTDFFAGINIFDANEHILSKLRENNSIFYAENYNHSYPHCWRHKTPLIFRATEQWFIGLDTNNEKNNFRNKLLELVNEVEWLSKQGKQYIKNMLSIRPDWCISRQRFWGIPITMFIHKENGKIHPEMFRLINDIIAPQIEKEGIIFWYKIDVMDFLYQHTNKTEDITKYEKVNDTLDVWFNSGITHYCVLKEKPELGYPADLCVEGNDQYRGWFQSSLITSFCLFESPSFKSVLSHGFIVDGTGHKMSKSLGNVISPKQIVDKYGADILRLWATSSYMNDDITVSEEIFARNIDVYRMIRNTIRYALGNLYDFDINCDLVPFNKMISIDMFAINKFIELTSDCRKLYEQYKFYIAYNNIQRILTKDISNFYFSIIKDRLYTMSATSLGRRSAQTALYYMLLMLVRLIAPILSFTAEEVWQEMIKINLIDKKIISVFATNWNEFDNINREFNNIENKITVQDWQVIQNIRVIVNKELEKLRIDNIIGSSLETEINLYVSDIIFHSLKKLECELNFIFITSKTLLFPISVALNDCIAINDNLKISIKVISHTKKCIRCWHYRNDIGKHQQYKDLCSRCVDNLFGIGENRLYC